MPAQGNPVRTGFSIHLGSRPSVFSDFAYLTARCPDQFRQLPLFTPSEQMQNPLTLAREPCTVYRHSSGFVSNPSTARNLYVHGLALIAIKVSPLDGPRSPKEIELNRLDSLVSRKPT